MWLEQLCESYYSEMNDCLTVHDDRRAQQLLQDLCVQVTGRNSTPEEQDYLRQGGPQQFEVLLHGYLMERRDVFRAGAAVCIMPPSGVVQKVGQHYRPLSVTRIHSSAPQHGIGIQALFEAVRST